MIAAAMISVSASTTGDPFPTVARSDEGVIVFPIPQSRVASPQTQIAFRGISAAALGSLVVTGSRSGSHGGRIEGDSVGEGASFLPNRQFQPGEVVTVKTHLLLRGARNGTFSFTIATPAGGIPSLPMPAAGRLPGDVLSFRSRPDLSPPSVELTRQSADTTTGDVFLTPQQGPVQNGPMILSPDGDLVWFKPLPKGDMAGDFRVQTYRGRPVLTWWQGYTGAGVGVGEDVIYDTSYRQVAVVHAANGLSADLHEFELTPHDTALITAYFPVYWQTTSSHGPARQIVLDSVVQEIDVRTGLVLFQWDSLDHVPLAASYEPLPTSASQPFDYFHINSLQLDDDHHLVVSARNTWAAYKLDRKTGQVLWTLGGKRSSFRLSPAESFAFQHDVRVRDSNDSTVTLFDDGAGPPTVHTESRALVMRLHDGQKTADVTGQYRHSPPLLANYEGNIQLLAGGDRFVGWGQQPYFSEFNSRGQMVFDGRFVGANSSYRAYRFNWSAEPATLPVVTAAASGRSTIVDVSWNGATGVTSWRVLAGSSAQSLQPIGTIGRQGFETQLTLPAERIVAAQALDARGRVLATSRPVSPS